MSAFAARYPYTAQLEATRPLRLLLTEPAEDSIPRGHCDICNADVLGARNGFCSRCLTSQARTRLRIRRERRSPRRNLIAWGHLMHDFRGVVLGTIGGAVVWALLLVPIAVRWLTGDGR